MRVTSLFRKLLDVRNLVVKGLEFVGGDLLVDVRPLYRRRTRCGKCGRVAPRYDRQPARRWRSLGVGRTRIYLRYAPWRVSCKQCGVIVQEVPWAAGKSRFTRDFEEFVAYLAQVSTKTHTQKIAGIAWTSVEDIIRRVVARTLDEKRFDGLRNIGVDEFSYRKRHRYLTIVVDHTRRRVIWVREGKTAETLKEFFSELTEEQRASIQCVTMDMAQSYQKAVREALPEARIVFDRFHVQALVSKALETVRRQQLQHLRGTPEGKELFGSRFALLRNPWDLTRKEQEKLSHIQKNNARLFRAYLLKETLAEALDYKQPARGIKALKEWLAWASRSQLKPFVKVARTIRQHLDGIIEYIRTRLSNGFTEGMNNVIRMIARRAFGFHSAGTLASMIFLRCGGVELDPPLPGTHRK
ncbi:MAG: ISL3 family transposase [Planctomycetes bacterium]|nr:ISL3 family transposase [Planctomycetota bacterium]